MNDSTMPSRTSIVTGMVATAASMIATAYIGTGLWSMREVAGFILGVAVSLLLMGQTMARLFARGDVQINRAVPEPAASPVSFEPFRPAPGWNQPTSLFHRPEPVRPDRTARLYRDGACPTEIIQVRRPH